MIGEPFTSPIREPAPVPLIWDKRNRLYRSIGLDLPKKSIGEFSIEHHVFPKGTTIPVVSVRNSILMGLRCCSVITPGRYLVTNLHQGEIMWMSDSPQEVEQHVRQLREARGSVLVGGLGIGLAVSILSTNENVTSICVIEKSQEIIDMVGPHARERLIESGSNAKLHIFRDCLFEFLKHTMVQFDFAFLDIWAPTSEHEFMKTVLPLRILARRCVQGPIECWNQAEMIGQFRLGIHTALAMQSHPQGVPLATYIAHAKKLKPRFDPCVPFYNQVVKGKAGVDDVESYLEALAEGRHKQWRKK